MADGGWSYDVTPLIVGDQQWSCKLRDYEATDVVNDAANITDTGINVSVSEP